MKPSNILFYTLNSISLVFTSFILFISLKHNIYRPLLNQFMLYILISEVLNLAAKYLSFTRNSCFDLSIITNECRTPDFAANVQLYIEIFSEMCTIIASFVIALKIKDSFDSQDQMFKKPSIQLLSKIGIVAFSLFFSLSLGLFQNLYYDKLSSRNVFNGKCLVMNCHLANHLNLTQVIIMMMIIVALFVISLVNYFYLKKQTSKLSFDMDVVFNQTEASTQINTASRRIMTLPIATVLIYVLLYIDRIVKVFSNVSNSQIKGNIWYEVAGYLFGITNGIKGCVFAGIIVFIVSDLKTAVFSCFKKQEENIEDSCESNMPMGDE